MKTISIRELHAHTGALVRQASTTPVLISDRGRVVAVLAAADVLSRPGAPLPDRSAWIAKLPKQRTDSTRLVSDDRDR